MELCDGGDLQQKIENAKRARDMIPEHKIWQYFLQIILGIKSLHDRQIVHRDIKCANVFMMKSGDVKLGDLNVSKVSKGNLL